MKAVNQKGSEIVDKEIAEMIDGLDEMLEIMTVEERLQWFKETQYPYPLCFEKEKDGTVYTVDVVFSEGAKNSIAEKIMTPMEY